MDWWIKSPLWLNAPATHRAVYVALYMQISGQDSYRVERFNYTVNRGQWAGTHKELAQAANLPEPAGSGKEIVRRAINKASRTGMLATQQKSVRVGVATKHFTVVTWHNIDAYKDRKWGLDVTRDAAPDEARDDSPDATNRLTVKDTTDKRETDSNTNDMGATPSGGPTTAGSPPSTGDKPIPAATTEASTMPGQPDAFPPPPAPAFPPEQISPDEIVKINASSKSMYAYLNWGRPYFINNSSKGLPYTQTSWLQHCTRDAEGKVTEPNVTQWKAPQFAGFFWWRVCVWREMTRPNTVMTNPWLAGSAGKMLKRMKTLLDGWGHARLLKFIQTLCDNFTLVKFQLGRMGDHMELDDNALQHSYVKTIVDRLVDLTRDELLEEYAEMNRKIELREKMSAR